MLRTFSAENQSPFQQVTWINTETKIVGRQGKVVYSHRDVEAPENWSQNAIDVAVNKYFRKAGIDKRILPEGRETSVKQMVKRVVGQIRRGSQNFFEPTELRIFADELSSILLFQLGAFNSPVWFNCGLWAEYGVKAKGENFIFDAKLGSASLVDNIYEYPQTSACFIQSVGDSLEEIFDLVKRESKIFKYGSGTGTNFSKIRGKQELLAGGAESSGLMSFLEVLDKGAGATKSGGVTRRAAKMVCLNLDHPEIFDFVEWKAKEEKKAKALIAAGFDSDFEGEAYQSISGQNSNNSVRITDEFMRAVQAGLDWKTTSRTSGETVDTFPARELWETIVSSAWECADPGVQFVDTINKWNPCKQLGDIEASNPCSEYMFLDETACNLASLNLVKFLKNGVFDYRRFHKACRTLFYAQDSLVSISSYPTREIARNSYELRPIGLGFSNLGALFMRLGMVYGDEASIGLAETITAEMHLSAIEASLDLSRKLGPFARWGEAKSSMLEVLHLHLEAMKSASDRSGPKAFWAEMIQRFEEVLKQSEAVGLRNSQFTLLAPTGTIGLLMDCDTLGVEPEFSLVKQKKLAGGGFLKIVNQSIEPALTAMGLEKPVVRELLQWVEVNGTLESAPHLSAEQKRVFLTAVPQVKGGGILPWQNHLNVLQACQPFLSGAISKTVNLPSETSKETLSEIYIEAWSRGLKSLAIYREGSKGSQPLNVASLDTQISKNS